MLQADCVDRTLQGQHALGRSEPTRMGLVGFSVTHTPVTETAVRWGNSLTNPLLAVVRRKGRGAEPEIGKGLPLSWK